MAEFRRMPKAITRAGQVKGGGGRHEKDDRFRIDDRSRYVLGWSNQRKLDTLLAKAATLNGRINTVASEKERHEKARGTAIERGQTLAGLDQTREFADIDWQSVVNRAEQLRAEQRELEAASAELALLNKELRSIEEDYGGRVPPPRGRWAHRPNPGTAPGHQRRPARGAGDPRRTRRGQPGLSSAP